ncbi:siphovirus ReqiPepy6 Gp37-like family protein [Paenibacillus larvae]|uniref:siphovirus ReqiPepy6 Gp37-like family protein n=1 Tax=Paenibacillus larvae TaxID=1464 RepID=UPI000627A61B|nr:siphovirus ReqiPepy6 Gp37-like family protein [Paenibacillus larvae]
MELYVLDRNLDVLGMVDAYNSVSHLRKYYDVDSLTVECAVTDEHISLLKRGNIIAKSTDLTEGFVIMQREGDDEKLTIVAPCLTSYLSRRLVWNREFPNDTVENVMKLLVKANCIETTPERVIPLLEIGPPMNIGKNMNVQVSDKQVLDELKTLSETSDISFMIRMDTQTKKLLFNVWEGRDLTIHQSKLAPAVFKKEFENVIEQNLVESYADFKNVALIAGAGEGDERKRVTIGEASGLDRYEMFVDARDLQDTTSDDPIPEHEYIQMLEERGWNKLAEHKPILTFESKINLQGNLEYKKDFDLGDVITAMSETYGVSLAARITEVEEMYDINGVSVHATLGNSIPTLIEKIKKTVG